MWVYANGSALYSVPEVIGHLFGAFEGETAIEDAYNYLDYMKGKYPEHF